MINRPIALLLIAAIALPGCATTGSRLSTVPRGEAHKDPALLAAFVQKLPVGSRIRVHLSDGRRERGMLMDATPQRVVLQRRTRIPEPAVEIPLERVIAIELENTGGGVARAIGLGIATGAGAFLGLMLLFAAIYAD